MLSTLEVIRQTESQSLSTLVIMLFSYVKVNGSSLAVTFAFLAISHTFVPKSSSVKNSVAVL